MSERPGRSLGTLAALGIDIQRDIAELGYRLDALVGGPGALSLAQRMRAQLAGLARVQRPEPIDLVIPDVGPEEMDEYLLLARSPLFDASWYVRSYQDVALSGVDPTLHYLRQGWIDGKQPGPAFSGDAYLTANPDVRQARVNPLVHFHRHGIVEQRFASPMFAGASRDDAAALHIVQDMRSFAEFSAFRMACPIAFSGDTRQRILDHVRVHGTRSAFFGHCDASQMVVSNAGGHSCLLGCGADQDDRALFDTVLTVLRNANIEEDDAEICGSHEMTLFARLMHDRFKRFVSEDFGSSADFPSSGSGDATRRARFGDGIFDLVVWRRVASIADQDTALRNAARLLVTGGTLVATLSFSLDAHDNWDIIARAIRAGFSDAAIRFECDQNRGIVAICKAGSAEPCGVFMLICVK